MDQDSRIYVAGHRGLAGSAIVRVLQARGYARLVTRTHAELDLTNQAAVREFFASEQPEYVFLPVSAEFSPTPATRASSSGTTWRYRQT